MSSVLNVYYRSVLNTLTMNIREECIVLIRNCHKKARLHHTCRLYRSVNTGSARPRIHHWDHFEIFIVFLFEGLFAISKFPQAAKLGNSWQLSKSQIGPQQCGSLTDAEEEEEDSATSQEPYRRYLITCSHTTNDTKNTALHPHSLIKEAICTQT